MGEQYRLLLHLAHRKLPGLALQWSHILEVTTVGLAPVAGLNLRMVLVFPPALGRVRISGFLLARSIVTPPATLAMVGG